MKPAEDQSDRSCWKLIDGLERGGSLGFISLIAATQTETSSWRFKEMTFLSYFSLNPVMRTNPGLLSAAPESDMKYGKNVTLGPLTTLLA